MLVYDRFALVERFTIETQLLKFSKNLSGSIPIKEKIAKRKYRFMVHLQGFEPGTH